MWMPVSCVLAAASTLLTSARWQAVLLAVFVLAVLGPWGRAIGRSCGRALDWLANRPRAAVIVAGLLCFGVTASLCLFVHMSIPAGLDERSYLVGAETFASGRLSNPTHPMWEHFETIHVIQRPRYTSKYPPAEAMAMALGIRLTGHPVAGLWLSAGLACAALCWMLLAWVPARWAVLGALLAAIHPLLIGYGVRLWGNGAAALCGSALLLGALPRLMRTPRASTAALFAVGAAILANSRPYEGLLVAAPASVVLLVWLLRQKVLTARQSLMRIILPMAGVMAVTAAAMGFYNVRTTGNVLRAPYNVHDATYCRTPHWVFGQLRPSPGYGHPALAEIHDQWEPLQWQRQQSINGWLRSLPERLRIFTLPHTGMWAFIPLLLFLPAVLRRDPGIRLAATLLAIFAVGLLIETWNINTHYLAPGLPLAAAIMLAGAQRLASLSWRGRPAGQTAIRLGVSVSLLMAILYSAHRAVWQNAPSFRRYAELRQRLNDEPGRHLVLVRYVPGKTGMISHVYNAADIDAAKTVWAWEMGPEKNAELMAYFADRRIWLLTETEQGTRITPWSAAEAGDLRRP